MKLRTSLFIVLGGYLSSLVFYLIWYFAKWGYSFYENNIYARNVDMAVIVICLTILYFFLFLMIAIIESFRKFWPSFTLVSTITLLAFLLIPFAYYGGYNEKSGENFLLKQDEINKIFNLFQKDKSKLRGSADLASEVADIEASRRKEHVPTKRLLAAKKEGIQKQIEEEKEKVGIDANPKKQMQAEINQKVLEINVNPEKGNTDSNNVTQEIVFKVQILSSDNRLAGNSPRFKKLKDVWEYKDGDLYKYTVGNTKGLKSASALKSKMRKMGFAGAFVVCFKNGKRIPVREALRLMN